jgi:hypothetical protein
MVSARMGKDRSAAAAKDDVEGAGTAVPRVGVADGGDLPGMAGRCEPVADRRTDRAALHRPLFPRRLAGDEEKEPPLGGEREL